MTVITRNQYLLRDNLLQFCYIILRFMSMKQILILKYFIFEFCEIGLE